MFYVACWKQTSGTYIAQLKDKKQHKIWGVGEGNTRIEAIREARQHIPQRRSVKKRVGWFRRIPTTVKIGVALGAAYLFREPLRQISDQAKRVGEQIGSRLFGFLEQVVRR